MKEQEYTTQALVNTPQLALEFGFGKGFDNYEFNELTVNRDRLLQWLKDNKNEKFFVFFHDKGPHDPYAPPSPFNSLYNPEYEGNITTDLPDFTEIGSMNSGKTFEETLTLKRVYDEEVKDYFWSNVDINNPKDPDMWTPFVIMGPGIKKGYKLDKPISHVDQMPTFLRLMNIQIPQYVQGRVLTEILK